MSSMKLILAPNLVLPWSSELEDNRRYWKIFLALFIPFVIAGYIIAQIDLPEKTREEKAKLPPQLARVVLEKKELPKPPPPKPKPKPEPKKEEPKKEEPKPKKEEPKPEPEPKKEPDPVKLQKAKEVAKKSGVLAFADDLSAMRDSLDVSDVKTQQVTRAQGTAAAADRNLINSGAQTMSGGVNPAALSTDTGGAALSGRETTAVDSKLAEVSAAAEEERSNEADGVKGTRSKVAMAQTVDANKASIFGLYQRALDEDPTLEGKVVFELVIEPAGNVSSVKIISSDLADKSLERKLMARLRAINFGAEDVLKTTLRHTFNFLPY
ncbi:MAG TPA: AgmX/PglI C-terminal domain-containing protein [Marinagarivorans sp.]